MPGLDSPAAFELRFQFSARLIEVDPPKFSRSVAVPEPDNEEDKAYDVMNAPPFLICEAEAP